MTITIHEDKSIGCMPYFSVTGCSMYDPSSINLGLLLKFFFTILLNDFHLVIAIIEIIEIVQIIEMVRP